MDDNPAFGKAYVEVRGSDGGTDTETSTMTVYVSHNVHEEQMRKNVN